MALERESCNNMIRCVLRWHRHVSSARSLVTVKQQMIVLLSGDYSYKHFLWRRYTFNQDFYNFTNDILIYSILRGGYYLLPGRGCSCHVAEAAIFHCRTQTSVVHESPFRATRFIVLLVPKAFISINILPAKRVALAWARRFRRGAGGSF